MSLFIEISLQDQFLTSLSAVETIGYAARAYSSKQTPDWTLMPYIIQSLLILLGPALFAGSIYMVLGRLIRVLDADNYSIIPVRWLTKLFLLGDILSILGQGGGEYPFQFTSADNSPSAW